MRYPTKKQSFSKEKDCSFVGYLKFFWLFLFWSGVKPFFMTTLTIVKPFLDNLGISSSLLRTIIRSRTRQQQKSDSNFLLACQIAWLWLWSINTGYKPSPCITRFPLTQFPLMFCLLTYILSYLQVSEGILCYLSHWVLLTGILRNAVFSRNQN